MGTPVALRLRARAPDGRARARHRAARRRLPRVVPPRLRERALAVHVQLRRRRRRRPPRRPTRTATCCSARTAITDGSFSLQVKVPAGGSVEPPSHATVDGRRHFLDVADPAQMKGGLDEVSLPNFVAAAEGALARSGATLADVSYVCGIHMKRSMHEAIVERARRPARSRRRTSTTPAT